MRQAIRKHTHPLLLLHMLRLTCCSNPFEGVDFWLSSEYAHNVATSVEREGVDHNDPLANAAKIPTSLWLDSIAALPKLTQALEAARRQQRRTGVPSLVVIVVYNLPGRDCSAQASSGELLAGELNRYQNEYLLPISMLAAEFSEVPKVGFPLPIVSLVEPYSCGASRAVIPSFKPSSSAFPSSLLRSRVWPHELACTEW